MRLLLLDDLGISGLLQDLEEEAKAIRKEVSGMVIALDGRVTWSECWNMSREDRFNLAAAYEKFIKSQF
jgi:hypothetical protein